MTQERTVVIGAGIGGLVSAALLAARGQSVTVVDSAGGPGGKMRRVGAAEIDGGPTVFTLRDVFDAVFADCGSSLDDHVTLVPATTLARHAWGPDRLDLFADPQASEAAIGDFAGAGEAAGYRAFRTEAKHIFETLDRPFMRRGRTTPIGLTARLVGRLGWRAFADLNRIHPYDTLWHVLGRHFRDPRLRQLFGRYATYAGSSPFECPATLMLIAHVEASGVWLIDGGMYRLARALETIARNNGAVFRYGAPVGKLLTERGRAAGVVLASGERLAATSVVCNADPAALAAGAFGAAARRAVPAQPPHRRSLSAMVWCAHAAATGFPLVRHNVFFSGDYRAEFAALASGQLAAAPSVYVCAQDRDSHSGAAPPAPERIQIIVNAPPTGDRHHFTAAEIDTCTQAMQARLARSGLTLDLTADATTLSIPADFASLYPQTGGALYGPASHGWAASFRRPGSRTRIPGLYCAGGSTHPGAGVPMAALSGRLAAECLLADCRRGGRASTSPSTRAAMPGGTSTPSATIAASA